MTAKSSGYQERSIALYCRVSTEEQVREGISLDEQQERLKAYCRAMGWDAKIRLFIDDGFSAKNTDRPELKRLLTAVKNKEIVKVMVTKLDRMSRRLLDLLTLIELFQKNDVSFISISESFDTNTPSGRLTLQVLGAVAEFERERIRERVFENMMYAAKNGKWLTQSPYGYKLVEKKLVIHEPEAKIVRKVYDLYLNQGLGYLAIAKRLNDEGLPSKQRKEWSLRAIKLMLTNPVYKGTLIWNRIDSSQETRQQKDQEAWITVEDCLPVIIDKDAWERVQERINNRQMAPRAKTSPHLLGGLIKCGKCGASMSIGWSGWPRRYRVYRCSASKNKGSCTSKQFRADLVEELFKSGLLQLFHSIDNPIPYLIEHPKKHGMNYEQKIQRAKIRYHRKIEAYTAGLIELEELRNEKQEMEQLINGLEAQSEEEIYDIREMEEKIQKEIKTIVDAIEVLPIEESKSLINTLVEKVILHSENAMEIEIGLSPGTIQP